ncbi:hypothetical protein AMECASPLE_017825 [Ameca splendens]|uniref:Ubiquitin-like protease family profile domain-containing protein n=1 Tax=Ameca splendens TaxID=208324 RepID=A0ABV1A0C1_9TELE
MTHTGVFKAWTTCHSSAGLNVIDPIFSTGRQGKGELWDSTSRCVGIDLAKKTGLTSSDSLGTITHTFQKDGTSCGVFVMEMAKMTVMEFPNIPKNFHVESSKRCIKTLRQDMAEEILKGSDSRYMFCSFYGNGDLLHPVIAALWIQCETCE